MQSLKNTIDDRGVLTLKMHRPEVHNAFDADMITELTEALIDAEHGDSVKIVVITGSGSCFSAGADLNWMRNLVEASREDNEADALRLAKLMRKLNYLSKPTIARVNGAAFGGGVGLIATCDISIAVDKTRFGLTESRLGLAPAVISSYVIRCIGESNARRYFLSGEQFDSHKALDIGLVHQLVSANQLDVAVEDSIGQLLQSGPSAVAHCKQLVFEITGHNEQSQRDVDKYTAKLIAGLRVSKEGQEGLAAFLEKRKPNWMDKS